jgi:FkbM family methyltransferase
MTPLMRALTQRPTAAKLLLRLARTYLRHFPLPLGKRRLFPSVRRLCTLDPNPTARTLFGATLTVDARDLVGQYIYCFGVWEPNFTTWLERTLEPGDVFIDVGAHVGYFSLLASGLVGPQGAVVAIEPLPVSFELLERNIRTNGASNVRAINAAAWDEVTSMPLFGAPDTSAGVTTLYPSVAAIHGFRPAATVAAEPLGSLLSHEELLRARMIKIDVEGAEWRVVLGLLASLPETRPDLELVVELTPAVVEERFGAWQLLEQLEQNGFHAYRMHNDYELPIGRRRFVPPERARGSIGGAQIDLVFSRRDVPVLL